MSLFTVRLRCLDRDQWISDPVEVPLDFKIKGSLLSLYYTKTDVIYLKPIVSSGGVAIAYCKEARPFWFNRLPHDIFLEDTVRIACQEGQMLFDDVA